MQLEMKIGRAGQSHLGAKRQESFAFTFHVGILMLTQLGNDFYSKPGGLGMGINAEFLNPVCVCVLFLRGGTPPEPYTCRVGPHSASRPCLVQRETITIKKEILLQSVRHPSIAGYRQPPLPVAMGSSRWFHEAGLPSVLVLRVVCFRLVVLPHSVPSVRVFSSSLIMVSSCA
ncbi:hypothetical protein BDR22DRAFT_282471 [Usnea florida]